ncbi:DinB family protein [Kineococcus sp. R86509]|uniref:DinB family protein n=1 Tax=Kineococcus sp. R86509 TaxID=3093851 RepID=UPI0036D24EC5
MTYTAPPAPERVEPPEIGDERATLEGFLEYHRTTFARKLEGLTAEQLRRCAVEPSSLSLLGLARHLAEVERSWWRSRVAGEDLSPMTYSDDNPDGDFDDVDSADPEADLAWLVEEQDHARRILAERSLEDVWEHPGRADKTVRWVLTHVLEEYARHNGHADLLRERIDGAVGE